MFHLRELRSSERGAVLAHVAIALLGLVAFSAFAVDYGVMWTARRQAQNAADAGALAGAASMAYVALNDQNLARQSALTFATRNLIWGVAPDVTPADITFPDPCPPGPFPPGGNCIRVNVFRTSFQRQGGIPLPTFFANLAGVTEQGVRATATARVLFGGATRCLLPFAIPDKWVERHPNVVPWSDDQTFDITTGNPPVPLATPDLYVAPTENDPGTGFTRTSLDGETGGDYGLQMTLRMDSPNRDKAAAGWYRPIRLADSDSGQPDLLNNIRNCSTTAVGFGDVLTTENGHMSTKHINDAIMDVVNSDPGARWDPTANNGRGGVVGGCMDAGTCQLSPRIRPVPVYDPLQWEHRPGEGAGQQPVHITKVIGVFIEGVNADDEIIGRVMNYPATDWDGENEVSEQATFLVTITLVR